MPSPQTPLAGNHGRSPAAGRVLLLWSTTVATVSTHPSAAVAAVPTASPVGSLPAGWQRPRPPIQSPTPAKNAERTRPSLYRISCVSQCRRASNLTSSPGLFQVSGSGSGRKRPRELRADCLKGEQSGRIWHHLLYLPKHFIGYVYIKKDINRWCPMVPNGAQFQKWGS